MAATTTIPQGERWTVSKPYRHASDEYDVVIIGRAGTPGYVIAEVPVPDDIGHDYARLIAAAPRLRDALLRIVGPQNGNPYGYDAAAVAMQDDWRAEARQALRDAGAL